MLTDIDISCFEVDQDILNSDFYKVKVSFNDQKSMFSFYRSERFEVLAGSFKVLGILKEQLFTEIDEVKIKGVK